ncbi:MAG: Vacuolar H+transporting two-sector ATPase F subunit [Spirochaetaceae bacterium 4572_59]|nr:MAG: Vacuolar H+transporting two-sector ATPase F subunit [Spirochaetaceae bacterium 4572_59]
MKFYLIGDEDALLGFAMVGVEGVLARSAGEASQALTQVLDDPDVGIILINERIATLIREQVDQFVFKREFPLILEIPDRKGRMENRKSLRDLVNDAIGIKL